jgi:elongator complex protein 6
MTTRHKVPQALEAYLKLPPELSQILLTGTLGCTATWLAVRFVGAVLSEGSSKVSSDESENDVAVVLVSWMRDLAFWKTEVRKSTVSI